MIESVQSQALHLGPSLLVGNKQEKSSPKEVQREQIPTRRRSELEHRTVSKMGNGLPR